MKPTTEDVVKWSLEVKAGLIKLFEEPTHIFNIDQLQNFAALAYAAGAAAEREKCIAECKKEIEIVVSNAPTQYQTGREMGATLCMNRIIALGEKE